MEQILLYGTAIAGGISLFGAVIFRNSEIVINFAMRFFMGMACIYFVNAVLDMQSIQSGVGMNGITAFMAATLGLPGVALAYGVSFLLM